LSTSVTPHSEQHPVVGIRLLPAREREKLILRAKLLAWTGNAWHLLEFAIAVGAGIAGGVDCCDVC
jgi:hypothetical protein